MALLRSLSPSRSGRSVAVLRLPTLGRLTLGVPALGLAWCVACTGSSLRAPDNDDSENDQDVAGTGATGDGATTGGAAAFPNDDPKESWGGAPADSDRPSALGGRRHVIKYDFPDSRNPGSQGGADPGPSLGGALPGTSLRDCETFDPGDLVTSQVDADCDARTPTSCPTGSHIDFDQDSPCALCVPDTETNRSCEWAETCFEPFLVSVAHSSGAKSCQTDTDCYGHSISACGQTVDIDLTGSIDEEITIIAEMWAQQNCAACASGSTIEIEYFSWNSVCNAGTCTH